MTNYIIKCAETRSPRSWQFLYPTNCEISYSNEFVEGLIILFDVKIAMENKCEKQIWGELEKS